jgi:hypothetical protein
MTKGYCPLLQALHLSDLFSEDAKRRGASAPRLKPVTGRQPFSAYILGTAAPPQYSKSARDPSASATGGFFAI